MGKSKNSVRRFTNLEDLKLSNNQSETNTKSETTTIAPQTKSLVNETNKELFPDMSYVDAAEAAIKKLKEAGGGKITVTTSQLRKILFAVNSAKNKVELAMRTSEDVNIMPKNIANQVAMIRAYIAYQSRYKEVKEFEQTTQLINKVKEIGQSYSKFLEFYKYVEALVSFHKYYGGQD